MNDNSIHEVIDNGVVRIAVIGVLGILALFLLAETINATANFGQPSVPATDTITVQGDGQATLAPDVAHISFDVQNSAATVAEAQSATTKQANAAVSFVKAQGIADKDIKTLSYNITPQYSYSNPCRIGLMCPLSSGTSKIIGYQVSETIQVTMRDLGAVGAMLSGLGNLQVQNVSGPAFALDDPTAGYDAARADAINKAETQAKLLASQLGIHLGKIVNFSESSGGYSYPMAYGLVAQTNARSAAVPSVPTGENTYNASVSITYEIR
ncbi:SIMPL domain-containing protein [Candidatus Parcubacteria bacterium]|nr:SIMPL domain-containing protein [Candidatus Parcubacteria bacterium]